MKRFLEIVATAAVAIAAFGLGLALMNERSTPIVFLGGLICLSALIAGGFRVHKLLMAGEASQ